MRRNIGYHLARWRVRSVLPHVRGRLLDIGCGTNELVRAYRGDGLGVDVFQWGEVDLVVEDSARLPLPDASFDTVTIIAALNHIVRREAVLREARRVLVEDGRLILTMIPPGVGRLWHVVNRSWDVDQTERGVASDEDWGLTRRSIDALLASAGFTVVDRRRFMLGINQLTVARKGPLPTSESSAGTVPSGSEP